MSVRVSVIAGFRGAAFEQISEDAEGKCPLAADQHRATRAHTMI
jgi:hypothetical protein